MPRVLALATLAAVAMATTVSGDATYDGLRVRFGESSALADQDYLFSMPRTVVNAVDQGWELLERPPGSLLPCLTMYCYPDDLTVCLLYDPNSGFVSGMQMAIPVESVSAVPEDHTKKFLKWENITAAGTIRDYWTSSLFFVSEEKLKSGEGPTSENGNTLQDVSVWAYDPTSSNQLLTISLEEASLNNTQFIKEKCVTQQGSHFYYRLSPTLACEELFTWIVLVTDGKVIGVAFQAVGSPAVTGTRNWFETIPATVVKQVAPDSPECFTEWVEQFDLISMHVFFVETPWETKCA